MLTGAEHLTNMNKSLLCLAVLGLCFPFFELRAQDALNRSVQVSAKFELAPNRIEFTWPWDWSEGGYTVFKKHPDSLAWGEPIAELPWGATQFTDLDDNGGQPTAYAFFKKRFEKIVRQIDVPSGASLSFSIHNVNGDGLCCNFGHGWYLLQACGETKAGGSDFGLEKTDLFQICDNGSPTETLTLTINPDMLTSNTWWVLKNADGSVLDSSGPIGTPLIEKPKYGYILTGKSLPPAEHRGSLLLVVDENYAQPLASEIGQLEQDLQADGWEVLRFDVGRDEPVTVVKSLIVNAYSQHPGLKMVYLLGHIPVPYSGNIYPDGHSENHWGAWPADVFYGDLDGIWTDVTVNNLTAQFAANHNQPGDGKFDQSAIPSKVELVVGRVDLFDMPAFGQSDVELTRRYLQKAHHFKMGDLDVQRRALVDDHLGIVLGAPAASGWRNFAPMFTADEVAALDYFSTMKSGSYLWSFGGGSGTHTSANGIGSTQDFASDTLRNIFTMLLGSQFGDWNNPDNFLRAPLASPGWTLTSCWAGNPPFTFYSMALGQPIGLSLLQTQNASESDYYPGPQLVHTALMGDPTLRLHPLKPPTDVTAAAGNGAVLVEWSASTDSGVMGYHVYRRGAGLGSFLRLTPEPVTGFSFLDEMPLPDSACYLVRAVKLETSGSGSYYNLSLGAMACVAGGGCGDVPLAGILEISACEGEIVMVNGVSYTLPGVYEQNLLTDTGCDSLLSVLLTYNENSFFELDSFFQAPGISFYGGFYESDTTVTVVLVGANGCDSILTAHLHLLDATGQQLQVNGFEVFPNPASGQFFIKTAQVGPNATLYLLDSLGRVVKTGHAIQPFDRKDLNVSDLPDGIYLLVLQSGHGYALRKVRLAQAQK